MNNLFFFINQIINIKGIKKQRQMKLLKNLKHLLESKS